MQISLDAEVVRKDDCLGAAVGDEQVLLDVERGVYIGLNPIGSDIWQRIERPVRVSALCAALSQAFEGDPAQIETDVVAFLGTLLEQGLIRVTQ